MTSETPDVIITTPKNYPNVIKGRKVVEGWDEIAPKIFEQLKMKVPELKTLTLQQFIEWYPYKFEIVVDE